MSASSWIQSENLSEIWNALFIFGALLASEDSGTVTVFDRVFFKFKKRVRITCAVLSFFFGALIFLLTAISYYATIENVIQVRYLPGVTPGSHNIMFLRHFCIFFVKLLSLALAIHDTYGFGIIFLALFTGIQSSRMTVPVIIIGPTLDAPVKSRFPHLERIFCTLYSIFFLPQQFVTWSFLTQKANSNKILQKDDVVIYEKFDSFDVEIEPTFQNMKDSVLVKSMQYLSLYGKGGNAIHVKSDDTSKVALAFLKKLGEYDARGERRWKSRTSVPYALCCALSIRAISRFTPKFDSEMDPALILAYLAFSVVVASGIRAFGLDFVKSTTLDWTSGARKEVKVGNLCTIQVHSDEQGLTRFSKIQQV